MLAFANVCRGFLIVGLRGILFVLVRQSSPFSALMRQANGQDRIGLLVVGSRRSGRLLDRGGVKSGPQGRLNDLPYRQNRYNKPC